MITIRNKCETGSAREIDEIGRVIVPFGETVDIEDDELAKRLLDQDTVWEFVSSDEKGGE